jgi:acyl carrier protein
MDPVSRQPPPEAKLRALVEEALARKGRSPPGRDDSLRDAGLTSLDMVNLMMAVEDTFELTLPESTMTPDHFGSLASIEALVLSLL